MIQTDFGSLILIQITPKERTLVKSGIAARYATVRRNLQVCVTILTASAFCCNHVLVLTKSQVTVLLGVQNTQQTAEVCGDAAWRSHVESWFPVLRCCQADDGVIAEASWREGFVQPHFFFAFQDTNCDTLVSLRSETRDVATHVWERK